MRFEAAIHGGNLDNPKGKDEVKPKKTDNEFAFKRPEEYAKMSPEEKKRLSAKMMNFYKDWSKKTPMKEDKENAARK